MPLGGFGGLARAIGVVASAGALVAGGYLAGNPDAMQEASRIFSSNNRPALAAEYAPAKPAAPAPAQAAKPQKITYRQMTPYEAQGFSKYLPSGVSIKDGIFADINSDGKDDVALNVSRKNKIRPMGPNTGEKVDVTEHTFIIMQNIGDEFRIIYPDEIEKRFHIYNGGILSAQDIAGSPNPEIIRKASGHYNIDSTIYSGLSVYMWADGKIVQIFGMNRLSGPYAKFLVEKGEIISIDPDNKDNQGTMAYGWDGNTFSKDPQRTAKYTNAQQQIKTVVSSSAPPQQKEQQLKTIADSDPTTVYATMSALYPELSDYFQVAADMKAGRLTPLEASLYLQSKHGLPLSPEGILLYGIQSVARGFDEQKRQEAESSAKAVGITSGSQPVYNSSRGTYSIYADGQVYNFPTREEADTFIRNRINAPRDYRFEKIDPKTGQASSERFTGTPQQYQQEQQRRAQEDANRQAQEKLKTDPFYQGAKKAASDVDSAAKDLGKAIDNFMKPQDSKSGSSSGNTPKPDPLGDFLRGLEGKKK